MYCVFMDHIVLCFALICVCYFPGERIDYEKVWRTISLFLHNNNFSSCQALTVFPLADRWSHCKMVVAMEKLEDLVAAAILVLRGARQFLGLVLDESNHLESKPCLAAFPLLQDRQ